MGEKSTTRSRCSHGFGMVPFQLGTLKNILKMWAKFGAQACSGSGAPVVPRVHPTLKSCTWRAKGGISLYMYLPLAIAAISPLHIPWFVTGWTHRRRWLGTPIAWPAHNCYVVYFEEYLHKDDMTRSVSHDRSCAVSTTLVSRLVGRGRAWPCVPVLQSRNSGSRQSSLPGGGFGKAAPLLDSLKSFMDAGERKEAFV